MAPPSIIPDAPAFAVVAYEEGGDVEALLAGFVETLRGNGARVGGLLQRTTREANGRPRMELTDIASGEAIRISQNLGASSSACCVDLGGIAAAAVALRRAIAARPEILVINKFSGLEAKGGGLRAEFALALAEGIPVLTGLSARNRAAFEDMAGGLATPLAAKPEALAAWWAALGAARVCRIS